MDLQELKISLLDMEKRLDDIKDNVLSIESKKRQLSVNSSGRVDEYEINKIIKYQFIYSKENIISGTLKASASYDFNESQMQGTRERENTAIESINRNLVRKLLLKFKAVVHLFFCFRNFSIIFQNLSKKRRKKFDETYGTHCISV